jgi:DNA-binding response OmpR family regulator
MDEVTDRDQRRAAWRGATGSPVDGIEFRRLQRALADAELACVPVVVLTALPDHREYVSALGAIAALQKPVLIDELLTLVWRIGDEDRTDLSTVGEPSLLVRP